MSENDYISLTEATRYCDYSQEYLSLRARQGKLKSVKFGRNWVTKKEWLEEYLMNNSEKYREVKKADFKTTLDREITLPKLGIAEAIINLFQKPKFRYAFRYALAGTLVFCLLFAGIIFSKDIIWLSFSNVDLNSVEGFNETINFLTEINFKGVSVVYQGVSVFSQKADNALDELTTVVGGSIVNSKTFLAEVAGEKDDGLKYSLNIFQKFSRWYGEQAVIVGEIIEETSSKISQKIINTGIVLKQNYQNTNDFIENRIFLTWQEIKNLVCFAGDYISNGAQKIWFYVTHPETSQPTKQGIVVMLPETDEETKKKIKRAFSDEVIVELEEDRKSGIIKPIFKETQDQEYIFILTPIIESE